MNKKRNLILLSLILFTSFSVASCFENSYDIEKDDDTKEDSNTYSNIENIFISEFYQGSKINDCALEIGTSSTSEVSLNGLVLNLYGSKDIKKSISLDDYIISNLSPLLIVNLDLKDDFNTYKNLIDLDDNYLYSSYYVEILDSNSLIVDSIGYKGFNTPFMTSGSLVRLKEKEVSTHSFDILNYIKVRSDITSYLGNEDAPLTLDEILSGPILDSTIYGSLDFENGNEGNGGYIDVSLSSLGDGDTTYFTSLDSSVTLSQRIRYLMIDTPEISHGDGGVTAEAWGEAAKTYNNTILKSAKRIVLQSAKGYQLKDSYGRYLCLVWYSLDENAKDEELKLLNFEEVKEAYARFSEYNEYETMYYNDVLYFDYMSYAKNLAKSKGLKIYGEVDPDFDY